MLTFFLFSDNSVPFRVNYRKDNKFSSTEPKFDISIMNITGKNTLLNSKNVFHFFKIYYKDKKSAVQSVIQFRTCFFLKFCESHRFSS